MSVVREISIIVDNWFELVRIIIYITRVKNIILFIWIVLLAFYFDISISPTALAQLNRTVSNILAFINK